MTKDAEIKKIKLTLKVGDKITILVADDDSILIVKNGDQNNLRLTISILQSREQRKKKLELANWQKVKDNGEYLLSAEW